MPDLAERLAQLEAQVAIRQVAARYMALCDAPSSQSPGLPFEELFTSDLIWEGVGARANAEFPRVEGSDRLLAWFDSMREPPKYAFNVHFLTSEAITVGEEDSAVGVWVMGQVALRTTGEGELRIARITMRFRCEDGHWRIARFQTESLYRLDCEAHQLAGLMQGIAR